MKKLLLVIATLVVTIAVLSGCHHIRVPHHPLNPVRLLSGPPPHAPAHGYRHRHHDHDMEYDGGLGAYLLIGRPGIFFHDNLFWRLHEGIWQSTRALAEPWRIVEHIDRVPHGLVKRHGKGHGKHHDDDNDHKKGKDKKSKKDRD